VTHKISLVTNVSANDINRIRLVLPHWLDVFGNRIADLAFVIDRIAPSGRLADKTVRASYATSSQKLAAVENLISEFSAADPRIRIVEMPYGTARKAMLKKSFGLGAEKIDRCQAGTPIAAFISAWEAGIQRFVLRADCDMLFYENGFLDQAIQLLSSGRADMVEPPRHKRDDGSFKITTRAAIIDADSFRRRVLPLKPHNLGIFRTWHRWLFARSSWLALEQMLQCEREHGRLKYVVQTPDLGQWIHVARIDEAGLPMMPTVAKAVREGRIPTSQRLAGWDFHLESWL
jgi:hypothetical protein